MPLTLTLTNRRKVGEEIQITETGTIPSSTPYSIRLTEVPLKHITTLTTTDHYLLKEQIGADIPLDSRFIVDYDLGEIIFNAGQAGKIVNLVYMGRGSVVWASDLNSVQGDLTSLFDQLANFHIPRWTTATRPSNPTIGRVGINDTLNQREWWDGEQWRWD